MAEPSAEPLAEHMLSLKVLSPLGTVFDAEVKRAIVPTLQGEITILARHMPLVAALSDGEVRVLTANGEISLAIAGGFLEVGKRGALILSDFAMDAESIEVARVQAAKERAERLLRESEERKDVALVERDLRRAILQLKVAENLRKRRRSPV
jgi:F-type H+-transporting ATPase subunit epsilon